MAASLMLERPAVYVMRRVSSGPRLTLSFLDMARVIGPWKPAGGGVPSSSCVSTLRFPCSSACVSSCHFRSLQSTGLALFTIELCTGKCITWEA